MTELEKLFIIGECFFYEELEPFARKRIKKKKIKILWKKEIICLILSRVSKTLGMRDYFIFSRLWDWAIRLLGLWKYMETILYFSRLKY